MEIKFTEYWAKLTPDQKRELAKLAQTTYPTLSHISCGQQKAAPARAQRIYDGMRTLGFRGFKLRDLRPDIWTKE